MITLHAVPLEFIQQTWPLAKPHIIAGLQEGSGENSPNMTYNDDHVLSYLVNGNWELFVAVDENNVMRGAATTVSYTHLTLPTICSV